ncbi:GMC family oxidoreductase [Streptomyces sp. TRM70350]|nr:GMC family oxidoreductase [Streptomyces sp. TRM70350]
MRLPAVVRGATSPAGASLLGPEPGTTADDRALDGCTSRHLGAAHHTCAIAPMRPAEAPGTVVDQYGRVHGISGLRVADTSILRQSLAGLGGAVTPGPGQAGLPLPGRLGAAAQSSTHTAHDLGGPVRGAWDWVARGRGLGGPQYRAWPRWLPS